MAWRDVWICENSHGGWIVACLNLPTREFYLAVGVGLFLWYGPNILTWICDTFVRLLIPRPHYRGRPA